MAFTTYYLIVWKSKWIFTFLHHFKDYFNCFSWLSIFMMIMNTFWSLHRIFARCFTMFYFFVNSQSYFYLSQLSSICLISWAIAFVHLLFFRAIYHSVCNWELSILFFMFSIFVKFNFVTILLFVCCLSHL